MFGHVDLMGVRKPQEWLIQTQTKKEIAKMQRKFTVWATSNCDLLTLSANDLDKMRIEFPEIYSELHTDAKTLYKFQINLKKVEMDA
jgi:CRP-like cAMP-binding protein